ncbi:MAG: HAD family hydrolase [Candidatus Izemoplasmatales bacterium]
MKYNTMIFDLDGTLLDTIKDIQETMNQVMRINGYPEYSVEEYKYFVGSGVDILIQRVMRTSKIPDNMFPILKEGYYEVYAKQSKINTKVYDGILDLINELKSENISVNVLSNKPHTQTLDVINYYFKAGTFDLIYGKKEEFSPKPDPSSAFDLISSLGVKPEEVIYVGDTEIDIQTSKNAGFLSVGVLWGFRKKEELLQAGSDVIVENPLDIMRLIRG